MCTEVRHGIAYHQLEDAQGGAVQRSEEVVGDGGHRAVEDLQRGQRHGGVAHAPRLAVQHVKLFVEVRLVQPETRQIQAKRQPSSREDKYHRYFE